MIEKAYGQMEEGRYEEAIETFSESLLLNPGEAKSYFGRGMAHLKLKKWKSAVLDFRKAKELDPEDPENWVALATCLAADNKIYEAIEVFEQLLARNPRYVRGHIQLARLYYRLGIIAKGHSQLDTALGSRPSLPERRLIEELKSEQLALDKRRYYRPDFEALRRQERSGPPGFLNRMMNLWKKRSGMTRLLMEKR